MREPRDADLILGQGSLNSGWHAHKLTLPGEFLISDPEHGTPERNRAYLIDDENRDQHAARYARPRPVPAAPAPDLLTGRSGGRDRPPGARIFGSLEPDYLLCSFINGIKHLPCEFG